MAYITKQQQAVLHCLEARAEDTLTANELAEELRRAGNPVGLATIYRQLEKLERSGSVHKVTTEEGAVYQYCPHSHDEAHPSCFLLRCQRCGHLVHLDCTHLQELYDHISREHHFRIDAYRTVLTGLCETCMEQEVPHGAQ